MMVSLANRFIINLKTFRYAKGLSQEKFAELIGFSVQYVSLLERGKQTPPLNTIEVIAAALKIHPLDLLKE
jgi:transcriptional regulator with XRE-family HTH domain